MGNLTLDNNSPLKQSSFIFGVATSSFQIEGDVQSRAENIWDRFCSKPNTIKDGSNGEPGCQHIKLWQQDVELIESLNVDAYRLSISWPRVIDSNRTINKTGLAFYQNLVKALFNKGIKVFVTLYHWDLPQYLEENGGWLNRETAFEFENFTKVMIEALDGYVYSYSTLNEPWCSAYLGYEAGIHAPGKTGRDNGIKAAHHLLLAHGLSMQVLQHKSPSTENGIVVNLSPCYPKTDSIADQQAAKMASDYFNDWYLQPLLSGQYPDLIKQLTKSQNDFILEGDLQPT